MRLNIEQREIHYLISLKPSLRNIISNQIFLKEAFQQYTKNNLMFIYFPPKIKKSQGIITCMIKYQKTI